MLRLLALLWIALVAGCGALSAAPTPMPAPTLRQLRQARGWAQLDVALGRGVTRRTVSRWEIGERRPSPANRRRLAELFGVGVGEIGFGPGEEQA